MSDYRIKGLIKAPERSEDVVDTSQAKEATPGEEPNKAWGNRLLRTIGCPRLTDIFYHFDGLDDLAGLWPTFVYLHPSCRGAIKRVPVHLAPYLGSVLPAGADELAIQLKAFGHRQTLDASDVTEVITAHRSNAEMPVRQSPIAMALASAVTSGSPWLERHREKLLPTILQSPEASYIAIASGAWNQRASILVDRISESIPLSLQLWKSPVLRKYTSPARILKIASRDPIYYAATKFLQNANDGGARSGLHSAALNSPIAASVSLGLEPTHARETSWWQLMQNCPEALYWCGRAWQAGGNNMNDLPRHDEIVTRISPEPRWLYHWARDLEPSEGQLYAEMMWPSPWAAELIVDLRLPKQLLVDLVAGRDLDEDKLWDSSLLLWGSDYVTGA
jgi:hypothetical protein